MRIIGDQKTLQFLKIVQKTYDRCRQRRQKSTHTLKNSEEVSITKILQWILMASFSTTQHYKLTSNLSKVKDSHLQHQSTGASSIYRILNKKNGQKSRQELERFFSMITYYGTENVHSYIDMYLSESSDFLSIDCLHQLLL